MPGRAPRGHPAHQGPGRPGRAPVPRLGEACGAREGDGDRRADGRRADARTRHRRCTALEDYSQGRARGDPRVGRLNFLRINMTYVILHVDIKMTNAAAVIASDIA